MLCNICTGNFTSNFEYIWSILFWECSHCWLWLCSFFLRQNLCSNDIILKNLFEQMKFSYFMWQLYPKCIFVDFSFNTKNVLEARLSQQNFSQFLWPFFPQLWLLLYMLYSTSQFSPKTFRTVSFKTKSFKHLSVFLSVNLFNTSRGISQLSWIQQLNICWF